MKTIWLSSHGNRTTLEAIQRERLLQMDKSKKEIIEKLNRKSLNIKKDEK